MMQIVMEFFREQIDDNYPLDATYSHDCDQDSYDKDEDCDDFDPYS